MARLSKIAAKAHLEACALLEKDKLTEDDRWFVYKNWQESANHINGLAGAFFTPTGLARDFALEAADGPIIDLCAGIGVLSFMIYQYAHHEKKPRMVCVEKNPAYVAVGKKLLPEAEWIEGDVFSLPDLGHFGTAISNPPFGAVSKSGKGPRYTGSEFEYAVIDIASDIADWGAFIVPQMSVPFRYSGASHYSENETDKTQRFFEQTKIQLRAGVGIDCDYYKDAWHFVAPKVEIGVVDFEEVRSLRATPSQPAHQPVQAPATCQECCERCRSWKRTELLWGECWSLDSMGDEVLTKPRRITRPQDMCEAFWKLDKAA